MGKSLIYSFILAAFAACSTVDKESSDLISLKPDLIIKNGQIYLGKSAAPAGTINSYQFPDSARARSYAMERRLLILKKFEVLHEPYFGTANAKNCSENLRSDFLKVNKDSVSALLQLPVNGEEKIIHDCLIENNSYWANIQFLSCGSKVYDIRTYTEISKRPEYTPGFVCR